MIISYCADIGSVKKNGKVRKDAKFGWARARGERQDRIVEVGKCIDCLVDYIVKDLNNSEFQVALGIESPLFLPIPHETKFLSSGRSNEDDRSCFAPIGGYVAMLGLHELGYILSKINKPIRQSDFGFMLEWSEWLTKPSNSILLWEAFVCGNAHTKTGDDREDAATAAVDFLNRSLQGATTSDVMIKNSRDTFSIVGALLLWADKSTDLQLLKAQASVVKPEIPYDRSTWKEHPCQHKLA